MRAAPGDSPAGPVTPPAATRAGAPAWWLRVRRFLRSPKTIVAEVLAIAAAGGVLTFVPQAADREATLRLAQGAPALAAVVKALALDRVVHSPWFLVLVVLASASLFNVLFELWRRAVRESREPLTEAAFRSAPFQRVIERRARGSTTAFATRGRLGVWGTPLFHLGLFVVVLAGVARALFSSDAAVELTEGEVLPSTRSAAVGTAPAAPSGSPWFVEEHGPLASPFDLEQPLRLERVDARYYPSGALESLSAVVAALGDGAARTMDIGINSPVDFGSRRLYLIAAHGPSVLLTVTERGRAESRLVPLRHEGDVFEASSLHGTLVLRLRGKLGAQGQRPEAIEVRALRGDTLLFVGALSPGQVVQLPGGETVALAAIRTWATFQGSFDVSQYLAWVGFALAMLGAALMFTVVRVDTAVVVTPTPSGERVLVALKSHRFAPVYAERFERLVAEQSDARPSSAAE